MRALSAALVLAGTLLASGNALAADKSGAVAPKGVGRDDCSIFTNLYEERSQDVVLVASWLDGYITSVNTYSSNLYDLAPWQQTDLLVYILADICRNAPEMKLGQAAQQLVEFLTPDRLTEKSEMVETGSGDTTVRVYREVLRRTQQALIDQGLLTGTADGAYGPMTRTAIEAFQEKYGIAKSGVPDQNTLIKLFIELPQQQG